MVKRINGILSIKTIYNKHIPVRFKVKMLNQIYT